MSDFPHRAENSWSLWNDLRWPSWLEIGVIVATLAILGSLYLPDENTWFRWEMDQRIANYDAAALSPATPDPRIWDREATFTGHWLRGGRGSRGSLQLEGTSPGTRSAEMCVGTCTVAYPMERQARYRGGVLTLDRAVADRHDGPFRVFYAIRIGSERYLVSQASLAGFESTLSQDKSKVLEPVQAKIYAYRPAEVD